MLLLMPAAGESRRFREAGYDVPKPLIKLQTRFGKPLMCELAARGAPEDLWRTIIGVRPQDHHRFSEQIAFGFDNVVSCYDWERGQSSSLQNLTQWALLENMGNREVVVVNCDVWHDIDFAEFVYKAQRVKAAAALTVITTGAEDESAFSFVNDAPLFDFVAEKRRISPWAVTGLYYFKDVAELHAALEDQRVEASPNEELYLSGALQYVRGDKFAFNINRDRFHDLGTPERLAADPAVQEITECTS